MFWPACFGTDHERHRPEVWNQAFLAVYRSTSMGVNHIAAVCLAGALSLGTTGLGSGAFAADMPVLKAPPPSPWVLDIHGSVDFDVANSRVTGGGLLLYPTSS